MCSSHFPSPSFVRTKLRSVVDTPTLRDRTGFWLALAAVLAGVGAVPAGIAAAATSAVHTSPWSSAWFDAGIVAEALAVLSAVWALILYVAHNHAEKHWCPDPSAHVLPPQLRRPQKDIAPVTEIRQHTLIK